MLKIKVSCDPPFKQTDNEQLITEKLYALLLKNKIIAPKGDIKINYQKAFDSIAGNERYCKITWRDLFI